MDRNVSRLIWEGFLEEWPDLAITPWSEAKTLPCPESSCLSLQESHLAPEPQPGWAVLTETVTQQLCIAMLHDSRPASSAGQASSQRERGTEEVLKLRHRDAIPIRPSSQAPQR